MKDPLHVYYDRKGQPISLRRWGELHSDYDYKVLAKDIVGISEVSTVWLGIDHGWEQDSPPIIFETMIFVGPHDEECWRYPTEVEALAGHEMVKAMLVAEMEERSAD